MIYKNKFQWAAYFRDIGLKESFIEEYLLYIDGLLKRRVPPIFEINHLALLLGIEPQILYSMVFSTRNFYRTFNIRKRSGGSREISSPYPSLLQAQKWILKEILENIEISKCAVGFRRKKSIIDNAKIHCNRVELLKLDIQDFFPSIAIERVINIFLRLGYTSELSFMLAKLCTLDGKLPQGAATSPTISNIVCKTMDRRILSLSQSQALRYTRYADDITVSGIRIDSSVKYAIEQIVQSSGFELNLKKTRICHVSDRKIVTGLDITTGKPRVSKEFRRDLQRDIYFVWSAGLESHLARKKIFNPNYIHHLEGRLQFWNNVEPESRQMEKCKRRLDLIKKIRNLIKNH